MKKILLSICVAALSCAANFQAQANTILINAGSGGDVGTVTGGNLGYDFTVGSTPLMITALGLWDGPQGGGAGFIGDGFGSEHIIGLWDNSGNLLAKATMLIGTTDTLMGEFRYSSVLTPTNPGPVILSANTTYVLGAAFAPRDPDVLKRNLPPFDPAVSSGNLRSSTGSFGFPTDNEGAGAYVGPNAIFSLVTNGNGVPEGGNALLMLAVAIGLLFIGRYAIARTVAG